MNEEKINNQSSPKIILVIAVVLFMLSVLFTGLNVSYMRKCELNYYRTDAIVTKLTTEHVQGRTHFHLHYTYFTEDGAERVVSSKGALTIQSINHKKLYVGEKVEIYVDLSRNEAIPVKSAGNPLFGADVYSVVSSIFFALAAVMYAVCSALFIHNSGRGLKHRLLLTWLPIVAICIANVLIFWVGLPNAIFGEIFNRVAGAIGYAVIAGIDCAAALIDILASKKMRKKV